MSAWSLALEQRRTQKTLGDLLVRELGGLWQTFFGTRAPTSDDREAVQAITSPLIREYAAASASVAAEFYTRQREGAGLTVRFEPPLAEEPPEEQLEQVVGWVLRETGEKVDLDQPRGKVDAPERPTEDEKLLDLDDPEQLSARRLTDMTGAARRLAAQSGRLTLERAIDEDPDAVAWARVTDGDPCHFCAALAGRGFVYITRETALYAEGTREPYHDHDSCTVAPRFRTDTSPLPAENQRYQDLWYETGAYFTGNDALNAFERAIRAQRNGGDVKAAVFEGPKADPDRYRRQVTHDRKTVEELRRIAQRGGTNGRPPAGPDGTSDPRFRSPA